MMKSVTKRADVSGILKQVIEICSRDGNIQKVILHGSWAKGTAMERSDIDIALVGEDINLENITDAIEQIDTLYTIDLVDVNQCGNDKLRSEVEKYGITIYSKI